MVSSTEAYQGLKNEDAVRLYLQEEKMMSQYEIDDFMRVYETLSIAEVSELLFEMIGKEIYRTYPPDMKTFIHDPYFLGTIYGDSIFPVWNELLPEIYPAPLCKAYEEIILSTATRCGKSTCIAISFAYEILLMLCMINPAKTLLGKASGSLVMAILSKDNQTAVGQVATDLYKILTLSPYFQSLIEGDLAFSNIEKKGVAITDSVLIKAGSSLATIVGTDLFACCLDEANIGTTKIAAEKLVETRLQLWQHAIDRRNATLDKAPAGTGIMWITSSPTEENDVIKARIDQVNDGGIPNVRIVDNLARWEARGTHATETFDFFIGSDTKDPCLLEDVPDLILTEEEAKTRVIKVPRTIEFLSSFRNEPIRAIQEIAGLRTAPENAFFRSVAVHC